MKKLFNLLCLAACVFCMTACSQNIAYDAESYKTVIQEDLKALSEADDLQIDTLITQYGAYLPEAELALLENWKKVSPELGEYVGVLDWNFNVTRNDITIKANVDYTLHDAVFEVCYLNDNTIESNKLTVKYTFEEQIQAGLKALPKAGLNTVIGMGVVFIVLILISLLIGCFKYINKFEQAMKNKKEKKSDVATAAVDNTIAQIVQKEEEELVDDLELVAVIAAAIAAHTGTSTDGFVVRSIRKSNKNKWRNA